MEQTLSKPENVEQLEAEAGCPALPCSVSLALDSVICGDNCETLAAMPAESVDLVVTSPPYDNLRTYGGHTWDFEGLASELTRVLKPGGVIVWVVADATVNGSETLTSMKQAIHFKDVCGLNVHDTMIYSTQKPPLTHNRYEQEWEYAFVISKGRPAKWNPLREQTKRPGHQAGRGPLNAEGKDNGRTQVRTTGEMRLRGNIWRYYAGRDEDEGTGGHPAVFPLALAKDHVASWSNPGDVVLDPFAGSGTTLKAAKELNRRFIGIEINPEYVAICKDRISQDVLQLFSPQNDQAERQEERRQ